MELVVQILLLFIIVASVLRLSFERGWIIPTLFAVVAAVFVYLTYPYAIEQTKTGLAAYIADRSLREYAAIFISLDVALIVAYSFSRLSRPRGRWGRMIAFLLRLYPGVLIFPVLFLRPEAEQRVEVLFLVELFVFILGIIASVDETIRMAPTESPIQWSGLVLTLGIGLLCFAVGYFAPRIRRSLKHN